MTDETSYEGGCLCGAVRYRATARPLRGVICHCAMCRTPALAFVHFPVATFAWIGGQPSWYRSSNYAQRGFCAACGSTLGMREQALPDRVQICVGSLDEPDRVRIDDHVWTASRIAWFDIDDHLPRFPQSSSAVPSDALRP